MLAEPIAVTSLVTDALDRQGVPYVIGGSLASSVHGSMRATMDADLVADLLQEHVEPARLAAHPIEELRGLGILGVIACHRDAPPADQCGGTRSHSWRSRSRG